MTLIEPLTKREQEILACLAEGLSNQEIAARFTLSINSVKWFARRVYEKLEVRGRAEAVSRARELGLLQPPGDPRQPVTSIPETSLPTGTVTFLFTDIQGSTPLWEQMPSEMQLSLAQHHAILRRAIERHQGVIFQIIGDAFQAAFRSAPQALQAALDLQRSLRAAEWGATGLIQVRVGLHSGEAELDPIPGPGGAALYAVSHTLNRTERVMSAGHGGQILLTKGTSNLLASALPPECWLKDLGEHQLKGMAIPEHIFQAVVPDLPADFPPLAGALNKSHNLPVELTSLVGREADLAEIARLLQRPETRLLTLTGPGGAGKTRLALRSGANLADHYRHGVWLVELGEVSDPNLVTQTVMTTLGLWINPNRQPLDTLQSFLKEREVLLILDNCEHLIKAAAQLAASLLRSCSKLRILATSRETLRVPGEVTYAVPSLALPPVDWDGVPQPGPAVQLFMERAASARPGFVLTQGDAVEVAQICRRLDGIPLAIELAAARVRALSVAQIAERLNDRFRLLTSGSRTALPRQQTLRATMDWSYNLLEAPEQIMLRQLSVFSGGWDLEAMESVCAVLPHEIHDQNSPGDIFDWHASLVEKSLVLMEASGDDEPRFTMLETVRQYASEKLQEAHESQILRDAHLAYFVRWTESAFEGLRGADQKTWVRRFRREENNIRAARAWSVGRDRSAQLRLARTAAVYFEYTSHPKEGIRWLEQVFEVPEEVSPLPLYAESLAYLAYLYGYAFNDIKMVKHYFERSISAAQGKMDPPAMAVCLKEWIAFHENEITNMDTWLDEAERLAYDQSEWYVAWLVKYFRERIALASGDMEAAWLHCTLESEVAEASGNPRMIAYANLNKSTIISRRGQLEAAWTMMEDAWQTLRELGEIRNDWSSEGYVAILRGDFDAARAIFEEGLRFSRDFEKTPLTEIYPLRSLAYLAFVQNDDRRTLELLEEGRQILAQEQKKQEAVLREYYIFGLVYIEYLAWQGDFSGADEWKARINTSQLTPTELAIYRKVVGELALRRGGFDEAAENLCASLAFFSKAHDLPEQIEILEKCAALFHQIEEPVLAVKILASANTARAKIGMPMFPLHKPYYESIMQQIRRTIGESAYQHACAVGFGQPLEDTSAEVIERWSTLDGCAA